MTNTEKIIEAWQANILELQQAIKWAQQHREALDSQECNPMAGGGYVWLNTYPSDPKQFAKAIGGTWIDKNQEWQLKRDDNIRIRINPGKLPNPEPTERIVNLE